MMADPQQQKVNMGFKLILLLYLGLVLNLSAETWMFNPPPGSRLSINIIQLIPLLIPLPWVLQRSLRALAWLCFILCFYFTSGVLDAWFRPEQLYGWVTVSLTVLLFCGSILLIRWQSAFRR